MIAKEVTAVELPMEIYEQLVNALLSAHEWLGSNCDPGDATFVKVGRAVEIMRKWGEASERA
jgi:hypothetical protein